MADDTVPGILARFVHVDGACDAIRELKTAGHSDMTVYSAAPNHEIDEAIDAPVSAVRWYTLVGGLIGVSSGFGMTIWMSRDWPLLVAGKSIAAVPAYVAIAFELMVLFGSLIAITGLIILGTKKSLKGRPYDPSFSDDRIGIFVPCGADQAGTVEATLKKHGAEEVTRDA